MLHWLSRRACVPLRYRLCSRGTSLPLWRPSSASAPSSDSPSSPCGTPQTRWVPPTDGIDTGFRIRNALANGEKVPLIVPRDRPLGWYSCGPTVYDHAHIGHAWSYVSFDVIRRVLERYQVPMLHVMNITDIDDKIIRRAAETGEKDWRGLARRFEQSFMDDLNQLQVLPPHIWTRVTDFVPAIVRLIQRIEASGFAYRAPDGSVYFDVARFGSRYRQLRPAADGGGGDDGARAESGKRDPRDFALWKARSQGDEPAWDSPFGPGRPGWHIECSAMAIETLGSVVDVHTGGIDLCFPHHVNEMAQSEAALQCPQWVSYLFHAGHVHIEGRKMSKSLRNFITIKDFLRQYSARQFRLFCLLHHYAAPLQYSAASMREAVAFETRLLELFSRLEVAVRRSDPTAVHTGGIRLIQLMAAFQRTAHAALTDDFDTGRLMRALYALTGELLPLLTHEAPLPTGAVRAVRAALASWLRSLGVTGLESGALSSDADTERAAADSGLALPAARVADLLCSLRTGVRRSALDVLAARKLSSDAAGLAERQLPVTLLRLCDDTRQQALAFGLRMEDTRDGVGLWRTAVAAPPAAPPSPTGDAEPSKL